MSTRKSFTQFLKPKTDEIRGKSITPPPTKVDSFVITRKKVKPKAIQSEEPTPPLLNANEHNIFYIDSKIKKYLSDKIDNITWYKSRLNKLVKILEVGIEDDKEIVKKEIPSLRTQIQDIESTIEYGDYVLNTLTILEDYKTIIKGKNNSFMSKAKEVCTNEKRIIFRYLNIAQKYVSIANIKQVNIICCSNCKSEDLQILDDEYICNICANFDNIANDSPTFKDADRVNMSNKYCYSRKGHFIEAIKKFQGRQNTTIPASVYEYLQTQMNYYNLVESTVSKEHLYMFLSEMKSDVKHYEDINLIYSVISKTPPPDINAYIPQLLAMFDIHDPIYEEKIKPDDRDNSQQVYFKLFKYLELLGFPCSKDDFFILKTREKLQEHDEEWEKACNITGWDYIKTN